MTTWQFDYGESEPLAGVLAGGAYISSVRITLLFIVSFGVYWLYWMYRTWKQHRDHTVEMASETGTTHHPVWHGLTQIVPVYGWFRYHAHIRQYKALMVERGVPDSLNVGLLTTVVVISSIVGSGAGSMRDLEMSSDATVNGGIFLAGLILGIIALMVTIVVLLVMQSNLNRYWSSVDRRLTQSARFGKGEVVCVILGVLFWLGIVAGFIWS